MSDRVAWADSVIWRRIDDEVVIITDDGISLHKLNKTAAHIWEMCNGDHQLDEIAASLCERFDVSLEEAAADVLETTRQLEGIALLKRLEEVKGP